MKVLHLIGGGDIGGAKAHVLYLVKELSKHIDVKIVSFRQGPFAEEGREMGIDIEVVKTGNFFKDVGKVIRMIREEGYDILHSHGAKGNLVSVLASRATGLPTVTTVHSDYRLDYLQSLYKKLSIGYVNTAALRLIDYHIGVSRNFRNMLIQRKFHPSSIFTVYNGIDFNRPVSACTRQELAHKYNLPLDESDVLIGILARLHPVKDIGTFLEAAKLVLQQAPQARFLICGEGEEYKNLVRKAQALGITKRVHFLGHVEDAYNVMGNLDVNVLTSISESFPYVILEGTIFARATISSRVGGISDLIEDGKNGYLFQPGDSHTLASRMLSLITDRQLRLDMGARLQQKARREFSLESMCKSQLEIYATILQQRGKGKRKKHSYDAIISGYYGFQNIGDDAMLMAILDNLKAAKKDMDVLVLSRNPLETRSIYNVSSVNRLNLLHIFRAMGHTRLFINGGGNLIQDNTSARSLIYYLGMIWLAKRRGMKVMIYANGIGPLVRKVSRRLTQHILNGVDMITLREAPSGKELANLNIDKPRIQITADPALNIEAAADNEIESIFQQEGILPAQKLVGFSVREWDGQGVYSEIIARAADHMVDTYGITPVFIPMHYPRDLIAIDKIAAMMHNPCCVLRNQCSVSQMYGAISRMEMMVGMRLHALIFAASVCIPLVGLVYEPKIEGFLHSIQLEAAGSVEKLDLQRLLKALDDTWTNREKIREQLGRSIPQLKGKALENAQLALELLDCPPASHNV